MVAHSCGAFSEGTQEPFQFRIHLLPHETRLSLALTGDNYLAKLAHLSDVLCIYKYHDPPEEDREQGLFVESLYTTLPCSILK